MEELIDVLDENGNRTGEILTRDQRTNQKILGNGMWQQQDMYQVDKLLLKQR